MPFHSIQKDTRSIHPESEAEQTSLKGWSPPQRHFRVFVLFCLFRWVSFLVLVQDNYGLRNFEVEGLGNHYLQAKPRKHTHTQSPHTGQKFWKVCRFGGSSVVILGFHQVGTTQLIILMDGMWWYVIDVWMPKRVTCAVFVFWIVTSSLEKKAPFVASGSWKSLKFLGTQSIYAISMAILTPTKRQISDIKLWIFDSKAQAWWIITHFHHFSCHKNAEPTNSPRLWGIKPSPWLERPLYVRIPNGRFGWWWLLRPLTVWLLNLNECMIA